jgi:hypothetical protein
VCYGRGGFILLDVHTRVFYAELGCVSEREAAEW